MTEQLTSVSIDPALAKAIVEAQRAAQMLERDGKGDKGKYTTGDAIAAEARRVLNLHGAAWIRIGLEPAERGLQEAEIGKQSYVGDVVESWAIVHESGAMLCGSSRMPVIVSPARPHDKAVGASTTYDVGIVLRGVLCLEREDKNAIDRRPDVDDRQHQRQPPPRQPAKPMAPPREQPALVDDALAASIRDSIESVAHAAKVKPYGVWLEALEAVGLAGITKVERLTQADAEKLAKHLFERVVALEGVPEDDAAALARAEEKVASAFPGTVKR